MAAIFVAIASPVRGGTLQWQVKPKKSLVVEADSESPQPTCSHRQLLHESSAYFLESSSVGPLNLTTYVLRKRGALLGDVGRVGEIKATALTF